jgi:hypothetical protein
MRYDRPGDTFPPEGPRAPASAYRVYEKCPHGNPIDGGCCPNGTPLVTPPIIWRTA